MTRFEAAALLNACLDRVTEVTDELKKLMAEFEKELAILKGRVDGLEAKVGELEANQFSTTTKLKGVATMVLGGASNGSFPASGGATAAPIGTLRGSPVLSPVVPAQSATEISFNYDVRLILDTSFTGKDLLRTVLRSGNFADSAFANGNTSLEIAFQEDAGVDGGVDVVGINRLFYQFPVGDNLTATFGAKVRQDDMLAMWPSLYPSDPILDLFTYAGARGAYSLNLGAGVGLWYQKDGFSISANFVSAEAASEDSSVGVDEDYTVTTQVGYAGSNWGAALVYTYSDFATGDGYANNMGLSAYWQPSEASWVPSISAGFGYGSSNTSSLDDNWSWMVGLQWADAIIKGNSLGMAIGSAGDGGIWFDGGDDDTIAYELFYKFQVTDNISVTPAFFYIENSGASDNVGGLLKTTFKF